MSAQQEEDGLAAAYRRELEATTGKALLGFVDAVLDEARMRGDLAGAEDARDAKQALEGATDEAVRLLRERDEALEAARVEAKAGDEARAQALEAARVELAKVKQALDATNEELNRLRLAARPV